tara:strand:+ start:5668 stop:6693 length:1026 start_codon:yes stop_codon:yes gene_type:complete
VDGFDLAKVKAQSWCVVSHHQRGVAPKILFGDTLEVLGIASERFTEATLDAALIGAPAILAWHSPTERQVYLLAPARGTSVWVEASSVPAEGGGLFVSIRPAPLGSYEELVALARISFGGSLLGPMAHELNNVVQGLSSAEYLFRDCLENGDAIEMEDVDQLAEAVTGLKAMGAQLQAFARISFADAEALSVPRVLTRAVKLLTSMGRMGIVEFRNDVPDSLPDVHWRAAELDFVILALLGNAVDASLANGQEPQVVATAKATDIAVEFELRNSGPLLDLQSQAQPGVTSKANNRHLGLGLSVAMAVVTKRGGSLKQVDEGQGTTALRLTLPLQATVEDAK